VTQSPPSPTPIPKANTQIDQELEEMKSQFLGGIKPKSNSEQSQPLKPQPSNNSKIDEELEQIKAKFLGNDPGQNQ
jgi:hypothetical protein